MRYREILSAILKHAVWSQKVGRDYSQLKNVQENIAAFTAIYVFVDGLTPSDNRVYNGMVIMNA